MKKLFSILSLVAICSTLGACNTISGAGKDIEKGGEKVQNAAQNVKQKM